MPSLKPKKPFGNTEPGKTYAGTVVGLSGGAEGHAVLIEQRDQRIWANLRKRDFKNLIAMLGSDPIGSRRKVMVTMGSAVGDTGSVADDITVFADEALPE